MICQADRTIELSVPNAILSIQPRLDGLSFAATMGNNQCWSDIAYSVTGDSSEHLRKILFDTEMLDGDFGEVRVCIPTPEASLVPVELAAPEQWENLLRINGITPSAEEKIVSVSCDDDKLLLLVIPTLWDEWFRLKFGERVVYSHPLAISVNEGRGDNRLDVDVANGYGFFTLVYHGELLYADVLPLKDDPELIFSVNRIIVGNKIGGVEIVSSGQYAERNAATLRKYYPRAVMDSEGEYRNILRLSL